MKRNKRKQLNWIRERNRVTRIFAYTTLDVHAILRHWMTKLIQTFQPENGGLPEEITFCYGDYAMTRIKAILGARILEREGIEKLIQGMNHELKLNLTFQWWEDLLHSDNPCEWLSDEITKIRLDKEASSKGDEHNQRLSIWDDMAEEEPCTCSHCGFTFTVPRHEIVFSLPPTEQSKTKEELYKEWKNFPSMFPTMVGPIVLGRIDVMLLLEHYMDTVMWFLAFDQAEDLPPSLLWLQGCNAAMRIIAILGTEILTQREVERAIRAANAGKGVDLDLGFWLLLRGALNRGIDGRIRRGNC